MRSSRGIDGFGQTWQPLGTETRQALEGAAKSAIGHVYNRIIYVEDAPRVERALSGSWDPKRVEDTYLSKPPGLVVVDDFLSIEAIESLYRFGLRSTVWSSTSHAHGRLGSQFQNGFSCPLLMQVAEELRAAFPYTDRESVPTATPLGVQEPASPSGRRNDSRRLCGS